jgi:hypothetical protein
MTDIYVSDLFGYKIRNESPFVVINSSQMSKFLRRIAKDDLNETSIWEYNRQEIDEILELRNVNPDNFLVLGNVLYKQNKPPKTIILGNKNWFQSPDSYEEIENYADGKIIRPLLKVKTNNGDEQINSLGLFFVKENVTHDFLNTICVIPNVLLTTIEKSSSSNKSTLDSTEFFLLASPSLGFKTVKRSKLLKGEARQVKLMTIDNKYLSFLDSDVKVKNPQKSLSQTFSYNAQGELTTDGKCLTYSSSNSDSNGIVLVDDCDADHVNTKQKWLLSQNKILPSSDFDKCLETKTGDAGVYLRQCDDSNSNQSWSTENSTDSEMSTDYAWDKYHGKTVVLVENDNPWFINQDSTTRLKYNKNPQVLYDDITYRNNADYQSNFVMDRNDPTLGFGYSFASRAGSPCSAESGIEGFGEVSNSQGEQLLWIMTLIILLIFGCAIYIRSISKM